MTMIADFQKLMGQPDEEIIESFDKLASALAGASSEAKLVSNFHRTQSALATELIGRIHAQQPDFFEYLVIDVLLAMGYGGRRRDLARRLGRTGDGGIDGLVSQDELGLDVIYVQAKRFKPGTVVPVSEVRDFTGSLDAHHATKGIFFTTSHFSPAAKEFCSHVSRRVVLVDGERLCELMIRHNVGVKVKESFQIKRVDADYFAPTSVTRMQAIISASSQPRR
jgi:restriction system protein